MKDEIVNASTQTLKKINKSRVFSAIHNSHFISRAEIAKTSNLSIATVNNLVVELLRENLVIEERYKGSTGGRRTGLLEINPELYIIGIELGETMVSTILVNSKFKRIDYLENMTDENINDPEEILQKIITSINTVILNNNIPKDRILGIGIGIPGLVDINHGISVFAPNWGWHNVSLKSMIEEAVGIPTYIDNAAKVMALGEKWAGNAKGFNNVITIILGTGIGAGIIINGRIFRGTSESAGEWGHTVIDINGPRCSCGNNGCIEAYAGVNAIARKTSEILSSYKGNTSLKPIKKNIKPAELVKKVINEALKNDSLAIQILQDVGKYLGIGIANLINLFDPEIVIIGGWVGIEASKVLMPIIKSTAKEHSLELPYSSTKIQLSNLAYKGVVIGAATIVLKKLIQSQIISKEICR